MNQPPASSDQPGSYDPTPRQGPGPLAGRETSYDPRYANMEPRRSSPHPVFWIIALALSVLALDSLFDADRLAGHQLALAQSTSSAGARGVFAFTGQLTRDTYGVHVVDVDSRTIWTYEYMSAKGCLRLAAARSWQYDRYLENLNACDLPPEAVEKMIAEQRKYKLQETESQMP